jgi:hypothetical protein
MIWFLRCIENTCIKELFELLDVFWLEPSDEGSSLTRRIAVPMAISKEQGFVRGVSISFLFRRGVSCCIVEEDKMAG